MFCISVYLLIFIFDWFWNLYFLYYKCVAVIALLCNIIKVAFNLTSYTQVSMSTVVIRLSYSVRCSAFPEQKVDLIYRLEIWVKISPMPRNCLPSVIKLMQTLNHTFQNLFRSIHMTYTAKMISKSISYCFFIFCIWNTDVRNTFAYFWKKENIIS